MLNSYKNNNADKPYTLNILSYLVTPFFSASKKNIALSRSDPPNNTL